MREHPLLTLQRSAIKFSDFWGLEREFIAGLKEGFYNPPKWLAILAVIAITISFPVVMLFASLGVFLAPPGDRRANALLLLVVGFVCAIHTVVFGHSRYHIPLIPILLLFAASAIEHRSWLRFREGLATAAAPAAAASLVLGIWARQILAVDSERIRQLFRVIG